MSIPFELQDQYQPNVLRLDVLSMHCAGIVHDVVHSSQSREDPCHFCPQDQQGERILSVFRTYDRMQIESTSNMVNMLEESTLNYHIVLQ